MTGRISHTWPECEQGSRQRVKREHAMEVLEDAVAVNDLQLAQAVTTML